MVKTIRLKSGIRLVLEYLPYVQSVATGLWVKAGAVDEDQTYAGISHYVEHMMFKGTAKRSAKEIAEEIDRIGGQINAFTGKEATCYYVKTRSGNFKIAADVIVDMITGSLLEPKEMDKERKVICEEIKMTLDTPDDLANELITEMVFNGRNLGKSIIGTPETLDRIDHDVMRDYIDSFYTRDKMVISVAGNFDEAEIVEYFDHAFESLGDVQKPFDVETGEYVPEFRSVAKDIEQTHICLAVPSIKLEDDRYFTMSILNNVMGGSMSSRLFQNIREEKGLAYSVFSMNAAFATGGYFNIYAGVSHHMIDKAVEGIREELDILKEKGITSEELESSREQLKSQYIFGQENVSGRMFKNGKNALLLDKVYEAEEIIDGYDQVTMEDIDQVKSLICDFDRYSGVAVSDREVDIEKIMRG